ERVRDDSCTIRARQVALHHCFAGCCATCSLNFFAKPPMNKSGSRFGVRSFSRLRSARNGETQEEGRWQGPQEVGGQEEEGRASQGPRLGGPTRGLLGP